MSQGYHDTVVAGFDTFECGFALVFVLCPEGVLALEDAGFGFEGECGSSGVGGVVVILVGLLIELGFFALFVGKAGAKGGDSNAIEFGGPGVGGAEWVEEGGCGVGGVEIEGGEGVEREARVIEATAGIEEFAEAGFGAATGIFPADLPVEIALGCDGACGWIDPEQSTGPAFFGVERGKEWDAEVVAAVGEWNQAGGA